MRVKAILAEIIRIAFHANSGRSPETGGLPRKRVVYDKNEQSWRYQFHSLAQKSRYSV